MKKFLLFIALFLPALSFAQTQNFIGTFSTVAPSSSMMTVKFNKDSTFEYSSKGLHPTFYRWENVVEKGSWRSAGDTIILNPQLPKKTFVEADFTEHENPNDSTVALTFNHIKRYIDTAGNITKADTVQISQLDYSFNEFKKKSSTRVEQYKTVRCAFAGYIPKEIITPNRTIVIKKPAENIQHIFLGCYELQGTKKFDVKNVRSNNFTFNIYSNYYLDGQIRQVKFLVKNKDIIYTRQKENGSFEKDNVWTNTGAKLKRQKDLQ